MNKKMKKILISLLACFMVSATTIAYTGCVRDENDNTESAATDIEYENGIGFSKNQTGDGYCIVDIKDKTCTTIEIPQTYNGLPIVRIEDGCFEGCSNLREIFIPLSIKEIGDDIFKDCGEETNQGCEIYYEGTLEDWNQTIIEDSEDEWIGNVYLYSEDSETEQAGQYWSYNSNGEKQKLVMPYEFWQADFYADRNSVGSYTHTLGSQAESFASIFMKPNQRTYIHEVFNAMNASTVINERVYNFELINFLADGQPSEEAREKGRVDLYVCALLDLLGIQENNVLDQYDLFRDDQAVAMGYDAINDLCDAVGKDSLESITKAEALEANQIDGIFKKDFVFIIEQCTTIIEALQLYNRAIQVQEYGQNVHEILIAISEESTAPQELRDAAKLLVGYIDKGFDTLLNTGISILNTSFAVLKNYAIKVAFDILCEAVPVFKGINLVAKGFQAVNDVIGVDSQCAAYYKLRAASILEVVSMNMYYQTRNAYVEELTIEKAAQYMNAVDFFKRAQYVGSVYYIEFLQTLKENAITDLFQGDDIDALTKFWENITLRHFENFNNFEKACLATYNKVICSDELEFSQDIEQNPEVTPPDDSSSEDTLPEGTIPENALKYNGHYYYVYNVDTIETWEEAQKFCESQGGYLATIINQEENHAIFTYLENQGIDNAYFGATDKNMEGKWEWVTGEPFVYSNWASGEPNNEFGQEDYIMFYYSSNGEWNDGYAVDVPTANVFICEWGGLDYSSASQGLEYVLSDDKTYYSVARIGDCTDARIVIPARHNNLPVRNISVGAFDNCTNLVGIDIPNTITIIDEYAFYGCTSLLSVEIPVSVETIGVSAFGWCENLGYIIVDEENENYKDIDGNLYSKDGKTLIHYAAGKKEESFTIPDCVMNIGDYAFSWCVALTDVTIPNSVKNIGEYAFNCCNLSTVEIPNSVERIGGGAFNLCCLETVEIPSSVISIGVRAFSLNQELKNIKVAEENPNYKSVDGNLYSKDGRILMQYAMNNAETSFIIPDAVVAIDEHAFHYAKLESITIPDSVKSIGEGAFSTCPLLTSINYKGTLAQWDVIEKDTDWIESVADTEIICSDGTATMK